MLLLLVFHVVFCFNAVPWMLLLLLLPFLDFPCNCKLCSKDRDRTETWAPTWMRSGLKWLSWFPKNSGANKHTSRQTPPLWGTRRSLPRDPTRREECHVAMYINKRGRGGGMLLLLLLLLQLLLCCTPLICEQDVLGSQCVNVRKTMLNREWTTLALLEEKNKIKRRTKWASGQAPPL